MLCINAHMENWNRYQSVLVVGRVGTLLGAARELGVHHTTIQRHIVDLEGQLDATLFYRHARGYHPTDAGKELIQVISAAGEQLGEIAGKIQGVNDGTIGAFKITTVPEATELVTYLIADYQQMNPQLLIELIVEQKRLHLEYGEAHVGIRVGSVSDEPDNVFQPLGTVSSTLCVHKKYVEKYGEVTAENLLKQRFAAQNVDVKEYKAMGWLCDTVDASQIVFRTNTFEAYQKAIFAGLAIGILPYHNVHRNNDLTEIPTVSQDWSVPIWIVTHVDIHRSIRVQNFLKFVKNAAARDTLAGRPSLAITQKSHLA